MSLLSQPTPNRAQQTAGHKLSHPGRQLLRLLPQLQPLAVELLIEGLIHALVGVGAEIVPLGLQEVGGESLAAVAVVVGEGRAELRHRQPHLRGDDDCLPPGVLRLLGRFGKVAVEEQILQVFVLVERLFDPVQELGPNDAAAAPEHGTVAVVEGPVVFLGGRLKLDEALSVGADFGSVQGLPHGLDELLLVADVGPDVFAVGPARTLLARVRASLTALMQRA